MGAVLLIFIGILSLIFIILSILLGLTLTQNQKLSAQSLYLPFTATIDPKTGQSTGFKNSLGNPQISCPLGKKVNIIGAFFDVFDPYTVCSVDAADVDPHFAYLCDPSMQSPNSCTSDKDCPAWIQSSSNNPFMCNIPKGESSGRCTLRNIGKNACPSSASGYNFTNVNGYCLDQNMCGTNIDKYPPSIPNPYCSPLNTNSQCAIRDASATVAAKCDGKQECDDISLSDFGDLPCLGSNMKPTACLTSSSSGLSFINPKRSGYCGLPFMPGYPGGVPSNSSSGISDPANGNVGYTMHGIYTCV